MILPPKLHSYYFLSSEQVKFTFFFAIVNIFTDIKMSILKRFIKRCKLVQKKTLPIAVLSMYILKPLLYYLDT